MADDALNQRLERWFERVRAKAVQGAIDYGDASFDLRSDRLVEEMREELADVCGWAHVLDERLERCSATFSRIESLIEIEQACAAALTRFDHQTLDVGAPSGVSALDVVSAVRDALMRAGTPIPPRPATLDIPW